MTDLGRALVITFVILGIGLIIHIWAKEQVIESQRVEDQSKSLEDKLMNLQERVQQLEHLK